MHALRPLTNNECMMCMENPHHGEAHKQQHKQKNIGHPPAPTLLLTPPHHHFVSIAPVCRYIAEMGQTHLDATAK